ncbi:MAG: hypothetical protein AAGD10_13765 [Myxococcota bacterium]
MKRALLIPVLTFCLPIGAQASPWALPKGSLAWTSVLEFQWAGQEFLDRRVTTEFPLDGFYSATRFEVGARYGLGQGFDLELSIPVQIVSFQSDPVILAIPDGSPDTVLDRAQESVLDFSQVRAGVADIRALVRKQWIGRPFAFSTTLEVKIPAAYQGPAGTFGSRPETVDELLEVVDEAIAQQNVEDDIALGDGQVDIIPMAHIGWASRGGWFTRAAVGYAWRLDEAGDEFRAEGRFGKLIARKVLLFAGAQLRYAVGEGRLIGVSVAAEDPSLPATEFRGLENLDLRELRLERDALRLDGGLIYRLTKTLEINANYARTVWGRNTTAVNSVAFALAGRI